MTRALKSALATILIALAAPAGQAFAQSVPSAYGHWEGAVTGVAGEMPLQVDIGPDGGPDGGGHPIATITLPSEDLAGLPMRNLRIEGTSVRFELPTPGEGSFSGSLAADGKVLSGILEKPFGQADFALQRTGEARFAPPPKNAVLPKAYVGAWSGVLAADGRSIAVRFVLANGDEGARGQLEIAGPGAGFPLAIRETAGELTLDVVAAGERFSGRLDASGRLAGTYAAKAGARYPLSLTRERD